MNIKRLAIGSIAFVVASVIIVLQPLHGGSDGYNTPHHEQATVKATPASEGLPPKQDASRASEPRQGVLSSVTDALATESPAESTASSTTQKGSPGAIVDPLDEPSPENPHSIATERTEADTRTILTQLGVPSCAIDLFEANYVELRPCTKPQPGMFDIGVDHTYMIHYAPSATANPKRHENQRKRRLEMQPLLDTHGIEVQWVTGFDAEAITSEAKSCFNSWQPADYVKRYPKKSKRTYQGSATMPELKKSQLSVVVKHHSALYDVVRSGRHVALILEDDALLRNHFKTHLKEVLAEAKNVTWDVMFVGGCMRMHGYRRRFANKATPVSKHLYRVQEARCAHAFVVTQAGAQKLLAGVPLTLPIDFQITAAMQESNVVNLWVEPWLSQQGNFAGGCVTNDLKKGVKCVSIDPYDKAFDIKYMKDAKINEKWNIIPAFKSVK